MPGFVKIGYTRRSPNTRSVELFTGYKNDTATGVPLPFDLVKSWELPSEHIEKIESQIHGYLGAHRVKSYHGKPAKEFFRLHPDKAIESIENGLIYFGWIVPAPAISQKPKSKEKWDDARSRLQADVANRRQTTQKGTAVNPPSSPAYIAAETSNHGDKPADEKVDISCPVCLGQLEIPSKFSIPGKIIRCPVCTATFDYSRVFSSSATKPPKEAPIASSGLSSTPLPKETSGLGKVIASTPSNDSKPSNGGTATGVVIASIFLLSVVSMCSDAPRSSDRRPGMQVSQPSAPATLAADQKPPKEITEERKPIQSAKLKPPSSQENANYDRRSQRIHAIHPDADSLISSQHFIEWVANDRNRTRIMRSGSGAEVITLLNVYKTEIGR